MPDLVLISGEEEFLMESAAQDEAAARLGTVTWYDADDLARYEEDLSVLPMGAGRRVFVVRGAESVPPLPSSPSDALIVVSRKKLDHPDARRSYSFPKLKTFDDNNEYLTWIVKEGRRFNIDLSRVANGLFVNCRRSLRKISSEIRKLSSFVTGVVTPDDLRAVLCFSAEVSPKDVLDAMCDGRPDKAVVLLDKLQEGEDETGWMLAYMQRHVLQQLKMERLRSDGCSMSETAARLGVHPFYFRKAMEPKVGLWSPDSLVRSLSALCAMDLSHKTGDPSSKIGLEAEVIRLSEEACDVRSRRSS